MKPVLEVLESRELPQGNLLATVTSISGVGQTYSLFQQKEVVSVAVTSQGNGVVTGGTAVVTDNGHTMAAPVVNGLAQATFTFPLFSENPKAHPVTASYQDTTSTPTFDSSQGSGTAPDTTFSYVWQLAFDYYLVVALLGRTHATTTTSQPSSSSSSDN
jgi:hypothetical protein